MRGRRYTWKMRICCHFSVKSTIIESISWEHHCDKWTLLKACQLTQKGETTAFNVWQEWKIGSMVLINTLYGLHHLMQDGTHKSFLPANTNCHHAHKQRDMYEEGDANYSNASPVLSATRCHRHIISSHRSPSQKVHQANLWALGTLKKNTSR